MTFPNAVAAIRAYLESKATSASDPMVISGEVPNPRPSRLVRLVQAGSTLLSPAHRDVRVVVECWEVSIYEADRLADLVQSWLCGMHTVNGTVPQGPDGWLGGPYSQSDPDSGCPRSVMTVILRQGVN